MVKGGYGEGGDDYEGYKIKKQKQTKKVVKKPFGFFYVPTIPTRRINYVLSLKYL